MCHKCVGEPPELQKHCGFCADVRRQNANYHKHAIDREEHIMAGGSWYPIEGDGDITLTSANIEANTRATRANVEARRRLEATRQEPWVPTERRLCGG